METVTSDQTDCHSKIRCILLNVIIDVCRKFCGLFYLAKGNYLNRVTEVEKQRNTCRTCICTPTCIYVEYLIWHSGIKKDLLHTCRFLTFCFVIYLNEIFFSCLISYQATPVVRLHACAQNCTAW